MSHRETITDVLDAAKSNLDVVRVGDHSGFYRHADVERMVYEIEALHSLLLHIREICVDAVLDDDDKLTLIRDAANAA